MFCTLENGGGKKEKIQCSVFALPDPRLSVFLRSKSDAPLSEERAADHSTLCAGPHSGWGVFGPLGSIPGLGTFWPSKPLYRSELRAQR